MNLEAWAVSLGCTCPKPEPNRDITAYLNCGPDHWCFCYEHRFRWRIGSNLFSNWRYENEETWDRNEKFLAGFRKIDPFEEFQIPKYLVRQIDELGS